MARARQEAPQFIAGALKDETVVGGILGSQRRDSAGEVLPAKGPARAPWPTLRLKVGSKPPSEFLGRLFLCSTDESESLSSPGSACAQLLVCKLMYSSITALIELLEHELNACIV
jgi:hypothetical protein